ncbi:MAG: dihydropteroate synthase [Prevotella sp.]|nr:dihydropteroate synthase [Prevotella sp.]MCI2081386.1 dihydropteroate synthase [Prevotella sp.]MCI2103269.1 dihydropteroate synthase [Prevotella sp.]
MKNLIDCTMNVRGRLMNLGEPQVMGIINVTPDSFYAGSRKQTEKEIADRTNQIVQEGGTMIDVGAFSTRPGAPQVSDEEEMRRLRFGLEIVRREQPDAVISVDTFRPDVAQMSVEEFGADIINDVSEGGITGVVNTPLEHEDSDYPAIFRMVAQLRVPYILMSVKPTLSEMMIAFSKEVQQLHELGVKDIILDPGYGFGKTLEQNYQLMNEAEKLKALRLPILVGISRKSMIFKLIGGDPTSSLNGTTILNTISLLKGANILRVHDVKEAVEVVKICKQLYL